MAPELPDPSFAKLVVLTDGQGAREALKRRLREAVANGLAPEARVRVTQLVFGPYSPYPVAWRVMGPDPHALLDIAERVKSVLQASPLMRTVNTDWGSRVPVMHFSLNQDRLQASGLSSQSVAQQLQFLLSGIPITTVREDIRAVQVIGRAAGDIRLDPAKIADFTLGGQRRAAGSLVTDWRRVDQDGGPAASPSRPHADHHRPRRCCGEPAAAGCLHRADEAAAAHYRLAAALAIASRRRGRLRNPARPPGRWCRYFR